MNRKIAESALLEDVKARLLSDDLIPNITEQLKNAMRDIEASPDDSRLLTEKLNLLDTKLAKVADAIETIGISDTLANRLAKLEREKLDAEKAIQKVPAPVKFLPDIVPALVQQWRDLVTEIENLAGMPASTPENIEAATESLRALLGTVTLKPQGGIIWAYAAPNATDLVETRPLDGLRINSPFCGSGDALVDLFANRD